MKNRYTGTDNCSFVEIFAPSWPNTSNTFSCDHLLDRETRNLSPVCLDAFSTASFQWHVDMLVTLVDYIPEGFSVCSGRWQWLLERIAGCHFRVHLHLVLPFWWRWSLTGLTLLFVWRNPQKYSNKPKLTGFCFVWYSDIYNFHNLKEEC